MTLAAESPQFGIFFDGTGNNMVNDGDPSYPDRDRDVSNIGKLFHLYPRNEPLRDRFYQEGVGAGEAPGQERNVTDLGIAYSFGWKIKEVIERLQKFALKFPLAPHILVDVFGFSRGAAQARALVNEVFRLNASDPRKRKRFTSPPQ